jgi:hypothetical protein
VASKRCTHMCAMHMHAGHIGGVVGLSVFTTGCKQLGQLSKSGRSCLKGSGCPCCPCLHCKASTSVQVLTV